MRVVREWKQHRNKTRGCLSFFSLNPDPFFGINRSLLMAGWGFARTQKSIRDRVQFASICTWFGQEALIWKKLGMPSATVVNAIETRIDRIASTNGGWSQRSFRYLHQSSFLHCTSPNYTVYCIWMQPAYFSEAWIASS
jgi:hypothetical protein